MNDSAQKNVDRQIVGLAKNVIESHVHSATGHQVAFYYLVELGFDLCDPRGIFSYKFRRDNVTNRRHYRIGCVLGEGVLWVGFTQSNYTGIGMNLGNNGIGLCQCALDLGEFIRRDKRD